MRSCILADLPILYFRNPWHYSFLEMCYLHCFIAFRARSGSISWDMCINKVLEKKWNILISKPSSAFPAPQFMTTTRLIWKLRKFAIRWSLQTKCVGGGGALNSLNKALLGVCRSPIMHMLSYSHSAECCDILYYICKTKWYCAGRR